MDRRREALGRNRRGPATRNMMPTVLLIGALFVGGGWFAYRYFTEPQRVFGARMLDCAATEITWSPTTGEGSSITSFVIRGCGRSIEAVCAPEQPCVEADR